METPAPYHPNEHQLQEALERLALASERTPEWWLEKIEELRATRPGSAEYMGVIFSLFVVEILRAISSGKATPEGLAQDLATIMGGRTEYVAVFEDAFRTLAEEWKSQEKWN